MGKGVKQPQSAQNKKKNRAERKFGRRQQQLAAMEAKSIKQLQFYQQEVAKNRSKGRANNVAKVSAHDLFSHQGSAGINFKGALTYKFH